MVKVMSVWHFWNGRIVSEIPLVPVTASSIHYGSAALEGIMAYRCEGSFRLFRPFDHLDRFFRSIHVLADQIPWDRDTLASVMAELIRRTAGEEDLYLRPIALRAGGYIGMSPGKTPLLCGILTIPFSRYMYHGPGLRLRTTRRHKANFNEVKLSGNYLEAVIARARCEEDGVDDVLFASEEGRITETSGCNVFFAFGEDHIVTPPTSDGVMPGVTRATVIQLAERMGIRARVRPITNKELAGATECFGTGTAMGVQAVRMIDSRVLTGGTVVERLRSAYSAVVKGEWAEFAGWSIVVPVESP